MNKKYTCMVCEQETDRKVLTVKRITFLEMGAGANIIRSRVLGWLCPTCLVRDDDWKREPYSQQKSAAVNG